MQKTNNVQGPGSGCIDLAAKLEATIRLASWNNKNTGDNEKKPRGRVRKSQHNREE